MRYTIITAFIIIFGYSSTTHAKGFGDLFKNKSVQDQVVKSGAEAILSSRNRGSYSRPNETAEEVTLPSGDKTNELKTKAKAGDTEAQVELTRSYYNCITQKYPSLPELYLWPNKYSDIKPLLMEAEKQASVLSKKGNCVGQCVLGVIYTHKYNPNGTGWGEKKKHAKGRDLLESSWKQGYIPAIYELVTLDDERASYTEEKQKECIQYIKSLSTKDKANFGIYGIIRYGILTPAKAGAMSKLIGEALEESAKEHSPSALYVLGLCQEHGVYEDLDTYGRRASVKAAEQYMKESAELGFVKAQNWMGSYHEKYTKNILEAHKYYSLAAQNGDKEAKVALTRIEPHLAAAKAKEQKKADFTVKAAKEKANKFKDKTIVFKGFYLGMDIDEACMLLNYYMHEAKSPDAAKTSNNPADAAKAMNALSAAITSSLAGDDPDKYEVKEENGKKFVSEQFSNLLESDGNGKLIKIEFPEKVLSKLYNINFDNVSSERFLKSFSKAYGIDDFDEKLEDILFINDKKGWNTCYLHEDKKGFMVRYYTEASKLFKEDEGMELKMYGADVFGKNTLLIKKSSSSAEMDGAFD